MKIIKRILLILVVIAIIAGIVMASLKGFNYGLLYSKSQRMNIYIDKEFNIDEIKDIAKEVLGDNILVQYGTHFSSVASIVAKEISEDQQTSIVEKIQEKFETEIDQEEHVVIMNIPQVQFYDVISSYIVPVIIISVIYLLFLAIRYRKNGFLETVVIPLMNVILALGLYVSIFALARIPINDLFIEFAILVYVATLLINTIELNKA